jgi:hypothetical protein
VVHIVANDRIQTFKVEDAVNQLTRDYPHGLHCLLIYDSLITYREFYAYYVQKLLEEGNYLVLIGPFYETISSVRETLSTGHRAIDVKTYEDLQMLLIHDSLDEYFGLDFLMDSRKKIMSEAVQIGKEGLSVVAEMGSFYFRRQIERLIQFETSLPPHFEDMAYNGICVYHQGDFDKLSEKQKKDLIKHHGITIKLEAH